MNKASELFDKVIVNNTEISITELENNKGKYHVGESNSNIKVEFILKNKKEIPSELFKGIEGIKTVKIPDTIESIGSGAFNGCSLTYINIPETISYIGEDAFSNIDNLSEEIIEKITYINQDAIIEYYSAAEAITYNDNLPGAISEGDIKTNAIEPVQESWILNGQTYNEDPTYETLSTFEVINDQQSWEESYENNGILSYYYVTYPDSDLISTNPETPDKVANFNDRIYVGTIGDNNTVVRFKAGWCEKSQKLTNIDDSSESYYMTRLDPESEYYGTADEWKAQYKKFHGYTWTLYTDELLTTEANKEFNITTLEFEGFEHSYAAWIANGAQLPWICLNFMQDDANVKVIFKYEGKDDVQPWGDNIFGNGVGHKSWGIASLPQEFGKGEYDINDLQIVLQHQDVEHIEAVEGVPAVLYTLEEAIEYNSQLPGAIKEGDRKPKSE